MNNKIRNIIIKVGWVLVAIGTICIIFIFGTAIGMALAGLF